MNPKTPVRKGKAQLIAASSFWEPMRRRLGGKRRQISPEKADDTLKPLVGFRDGDTRVDMRDCSQEKVVLSRIFPTFHFLYHKIIFERLPRLNSLPRPGQIAWFEEERGFQSPTKSKKREFAAAHEETGGLKLPKKLRGLLNNLLEKTVPDRATFKAVLNDALKETEVE